MIEGDDQRKEWMGRGWAYPVRIDGGSGSAALSAYEQDIREAIRILLETAPGERVMRPNFGCGIHDLVFESIDKTALTRIETAIRKAVMQYEARIDLLSILTDARNAVDGQLLVELQYRVRQTNQIGNLAYPFYFREGRPPAPSAGET